LPHSGRAEQTGARAEHNERIHGATVIVFSTCDVDAAFDLAVLDWREVLMSAGLADADWRSHVDRWFAHRAEG